MGRYYIPKENIKVKINGKYVSWAELEKHKIKKIDLKKLRSLSTHLDT